MDARTATAAPAEQPGKSALVQRFVDALAARSGLAFAVALPDGTLSVGGSGEPASGSSRRCCRMASCLLSCRS